MIDSAIKSWVKDPEANIPGVLKNYFELNANKMKYNHLFLSILFGTEDFEAEKLKMVERSKNFQSIWAKTLTSKDVAWKWETCELDPTCIICAECFEKSNHEGHKVRLQRGAAGWWDWGDSTAWNPSGFCTDHAGYVDYTDDKINELLPKGMGRRAKVLFYALGEFLHSILLRKDYENENSQFVQLKIFLVIDVISTWLDLSPLFIHFLTKMFMRIHPYLGKTNHECAELAYVDEEHKLEWNLQFEKNFETISDQTEDHQFTWRWPLISLIFRFKNKSIYKVFTDNVIFKMFQSLRFKILLGLAYVSNYDSLLEDKSNDNGYIHLGVQILTIPEISVRIIENKNLSKL